MFTKLGQVIESLGHVSFSDRPLKIRHLLHIQDIGNNCLITIVNNLKVNQGRSP